MERTWCLREFHKSATSSPLLPADINEWIQGGDHVWPRLRKLTGTLAFLSLSSHKTHPSMCHLRLGPAAVPRLLPGEELSIICPLGNLSQKKIQTIYILSLHPLQVSLAGWLASLTPISPHAPTLVREREKRKTEGYSFFKCQTTAPSRCLCLVEFAILWEKKQTQGQISFLNHLRCPCFAPNYDAAAAVCVARRHCGKFQREALSQAHSRMWRNPQSARTEADTLLTINIYISDPFLPSHPLVSYLAYCLWLSHLPLPYRGVRAKKKEIPSFPPCLFPACLPRICLWSLHNARRCLKCTHSGGSAREVQSDHCDLCGAFITDERWTFLKHSNTTFFWSLKLVGYWVHCNPC